MNSNIYGKSADFVPYFIILANYDARLRKMSEFLKNENIRPKNPSHLTGTSVLPASFAEVR
jgi:hypothetical protein